MGSKKGFRRPSGAGLKERFVNGIGSIAPSAKRRSTCNTKETLTKGVGGRGKAVSKEDAPRNNGGGYPESGLAVFDTLRHHLHKQARLHCLLADFCTHLQYFQVHFSP